MRDMLAEAGLIERVAHELLGEPNRSLSRPGNLRYGTHGSLSIDTTTDTWFDHEIGTGGGVLDLVVRHRGGDRAEAARWCDEHGHISRENARTWDYRDETGALLYQVVRLEPKSFRQRRPDGRGGWDWSIKGVRRVPYRLPELLAADPAATVYIVEGEKDVDRLVALEQVATTNAGGAGKWPDEFADHLTGRRVSIIPDNDDAGRDHAARVASSLTRRGIDHRVLTLPGLPEKGDVSDWLNAGGTVPELVKMHEAAPKPLAVPLLTMPGLLPAGAVALPPPRTVPPAPAFRFVAVGDLAWREPEFLIDGMIETDTLGMIFGDPGCGKSFLAVDLALSVASGTAFHGREVKQGAVFFIAGEGHNGLARRFHAWGKARGVPLSGVPLFKSERAAQFLDVTSAKAVGDAVGAMAGAHGVPALIIVDTVARCFGPGDENSTSDMGGFIAAIDDLKARYPGCTVLLVHHSGHADKQRARGAMALKGALDCEFRVEKDGDTLALINTKMKDAEPPKDQFFMFRRVELGGDASSAVLDGTAAPLRQPRLTPTQQMAVETYTSAAAVHGVWERGAFRGLHVEDWRDAFYAKHTGDNQHAKKVAFQRVRADLVAQGSMRVESDVYLTTDTTTQMVVVMLKQTGTGGTSTAHVPPVPLDRHSGTHRHIDGTCAGAEADTPGTSGTHPFRGVPLCRSDWGQQ